MISGGLADDGVLDPISISLQGEGGEWPPRREALRTTPRRRWARRRRLARYRRVFEAKEAPAMPVLV